MKPEQQRIAIAEACGLLVCCKADPDNPEAWKTGHFSPSAAKQRRMRWPSSAIVKIIPDYLTDLNACHEAEKVLRLEHVVRYEKTLWLLVKCAWEKASDKKTPIGTWHSTAAQRAEAFLRTIGKWEDDK